MDRGKRIWIGRFAPVNAAPRRKTGGLRGCQEHSKLVLLVFVKLGLVGGKASAGFGQSFENLLRGFVPAINKGFCHERHVMAMRGDMCINAGAITAVQPDCDDAKAVCILSGGCFGGGIKIGGLVRVIGISQPEGGAIRCRIECIFGLGCERGKKQKETGDQGRVFHSGFTPGSRSPRFLAVLRQSSAGRIRPQSGAPARRIC